MFTSTHLKPALNYSLALLLSLCCLPIAVFAASQDYQQILINEYGGPEVLTTVTHNTLPEPGPGEVRIKVLTASASFTDVMVRKGLYQGVSAELPYAPGYDLVGVIDKVGEGVNEFKVGQRVADLTIWGAYTQYAIRPSQYLVPVPEQLDTGEAVSLILSYTTAYQMLHRSAKVEAGQSVLIHGASGAVGMALAQLGRVAGLNMYGTASTKKQDFVRQLGVNPIDYKTEDFVDRVMNDTGQQGVDIVFDAISIDNFERSFSTLKPGGQLITYGFYTTTLTADSGDGLALAKEFFGWLWLQFKWNWLPNEGRSAQMYSITSMREEHPEWFREDMTALFELLATEKIKPSIWKTLPLSEAAQAHQYIEAGKVKGKIVLQVSE